MINFKGRVALVPGANGGIGSVVAETLAKAGADLALTYNKQTARVEEVARFAREQGRHVSVDKLDARDRHAVDSWVTDKISEFGKVDILMNCLGWSGHTSFVLFTEQDPDTWQEVMDIEMMSLAYLSRAVINHMIERRYGRIVTVGSDSSRALAQLRVWAKDELFIRTATSTEPTRRAMELAGPLSEALTGVQRAFNPEQVGAPAPARIHFALTDYAVLLYQDP